MSEEEVTNTERGKARVNLVTSDGNWKYQDEFMGLKCIEIDMQRSKLDMYVSVHVFPNSGHVENLNNVTDLKLIMRKHQINPY